MRLAEKQHTVAAAKSKGVAQRVPEMAIAVLQAKLRPAGGIERARIECTGRETSLEREQADYGLQNSSRTQRMAGPALCRTGARVCWKQLRHQASLHLVVFLARCAVQVDVVDVVRRKASAFERSCDGMACAQAIRVRRGHMVSVARFAIAEQPRPMPTPFEQGEPGRLTDIDPASVGIEGLAGLRRDQLESIEAE